MTHPTTAVRGDQANPSARQPDHALRRDVRTRERESPGSRRPSRFVTASGLSVAAAALILAGGYVHYCLYRHGYRFIPKIGVSFLLQAAASVVLAAALLFQRGRLRVGRHSVAVAQLTRLSAIGLSLGTLAALAIAHTPGGLFQFREIGLRPAPQTLIAIVAESVAVLLLGVAMVEGRSATRSQTVRAAVASPGHAVGDAASADPTRARCA